MKIVWLRRDLRLYDHQALHHALKAGGPVLPLFIFDHDILKKIEDKDDLRVNFIHEELTKIKKQLNLYESDLLVKQGEVLAIWKELVKTYPIEAVYFNADYSPRERLRDEKVTTFLQKEKIEVFNFNDHLVFKPDEITKDDGTPYSVYTFYKNRWFERFSPTCFIDYEVKKFKKNFLKINKLPMLTLADIGFVEQSSNVRPINLDKSLLKNYEENRNFPDRNGTSNIGVHLRFGTISVRECLRVAYDHSYTFVSEIAWRDFFSMLLFYYPKTINEEFKKEFRYIKWNTSEAQFLKWCRGETGFPLVDAGMRELNETGYMHNRVRMITASFLVKDLLIDWRKGERYFARKLLDYDLSSNIGNWQWVAGTGADAAPYFRVFNPEIQLKKFDPDFKYVKKWVPEYGTDKYQKPMIYRKNSIKNTKEAYTTSVDIYSHFKNH